MEHDANKQVIQDYIDEVKQSIYEPIVTRHLSDNPVDGIKAFFLLLPLLNGEKWSGHIHRSAVAVGAVHAAFYVHDQIDLSDATPKEQQMLVLSGDHFSGVYYRLLASLPDFSFIRSLSEMIGRINETKTSMMKKPPMGMNQLVDMVKVIEVGCIADFHQAFGFSRYSSLAEAALPLLWIGERLAAEPDSQECVISRNVRMADMKDAHATLSVILKSTLESAHFLAPALKMAIYELACSQVMPIQIGDE